MPRTPDPRIAFSNARVSARLRRRAAVQTHCRQATKSTSSNSMLGVYTLSFAPVNFGALVGLARPRTELHEDDASRLRRSGHQGFSIFPVN